MVVLGFYLRVVVRPSPFSRVFIRNGIIQLNVRVLVEFTNFTEGLLIGGLIFLL
jgi:hypothetical protein